jgi:hypothetical protein
MDVLLCCELGNVFTEPLPSNAHTCHNIIFLPVFVLICVGKGLATGRPPLPLSKESYQMSINNNLEVRKRETLDCLDLS